MSNNPTAIFKYFKMLKASSTNVQSLKVGDQTFMGESVPDGFFFSMTSLKSCDIELLRCDPSLMNHFTNYDHIMELCKNSLSEIPPVTAVKAADLLSRIKKDVKDYYGITARHYLNAGAEGVNLFCDVINAIIYNVNNAAIAEMNTAHGLILHKGHNKDKNKIVTDYTVL